MVVAIVLGISITNLLNKLAITLRVGNWGTLWFRPLWCVILLICTIGYLWAFWRIYLDYTEISIWAFIFGPFFTVPPLITAKKVQIFSRASRNGGCEVVCNDGFEYRKPGMQSHEL